MPATSKLFSVVKYRRGGKTIIREHYMIKLDEATATITYLEYPEGEPPKESVEERLKRLRERVRRQI